MPGHRRTKSKNAITRGRGSDAYQLINKISTAGFSVSMIYGNARQSEPITPGIRHIKYLKLLFLRNE